MSIINLGLATRGMDSATRFKILKRHFFAFLKHMTLKKIINFILTEFNRLNQKIRISSYPYILKIESTNICNVKCAYCYEGRRQSIKGERPYGRMSLENFKKLIDEIGSYLFKINLYGFGEPFLFPETLKMIEYATNKNIGIGVSSNMNFDDPTLPHCIVESGLEVLIFSCHGVTRESYSKFMVKGNMDIAFKNIKNVIEEKRKINSKTPFIDWQFCVTKFNQHELDLAKAKSREIGIDQIRFIEPYFPVDVVDKGWFSDMFPRRNDANLSGNKQIGCSWPYRSGFIAYDGGLLPCCKEERLLAHDFGNVFKEGFKSVWNNISYRSSRSLIANHSGENIPCSTICASCPITQSNS